MTNEEKSRYYNFTPGEKINGRFWAHSQIGRGAYGTVVKAYNYKEGKDVAIKFFKSGSSFKNVGVEETYILNLIYEYNKNLRYPIIYHFGHMIWKNHFSIIFPLYNYNLYYTVKKAKGQGFKLSVIKHIATQLLECLFFLQHPKLQIIHTDIKPDNVIFVNSRTFDIKLIDFGSYLRNPPRQVNYLIQTVYYRCPEVILGLKFGYAIDMWSLGCLLYEIYTGKVLFHESNDIEILKTIVEVLGVPPMEMLFKSGQSEKWFVFNETKTAVKEIKKYSRFPPGQRSLENLLKSYFANEPNPEEAASFLNLLKQMLDYKQDKRITVLEALNHPFIESQESYAHDYPVSEKQAPNIFGNYGDNLSISEQNLVKEFETMCFVPQTEIMNQINNRKNIMKSALELNKTYNLNLPQEKKLNKEINHSVEEKTYSKNAKLME